MSKKEKIWAGIFLIWDIFAIVMYIRMGDYSSVAWLCLSSFMLFLLWMQKRAANKVSALLDLLERIICMKNNIINDLERDNAILSNANTILKNKLEEMNDGRKKTDKRGDADACSEGV